jgi:hypothetical protein
LLEQPKSAQRKSYQYENRFILPNPLIIFLTDESLGTIEESAITVDLVDSKDRSVPFLHSKNGILTQSLDPNKQARFVLKMTEGHPKDRYRIVFHVRYRLEGETEWHEERVVSREFRLRCANSQLKKE